MSLFSIVIPTRNRAELLKYAVTSVLEQTFDDFELIVSNNNSTDNTVNLCKSLGVNYISTGKTLPLNESWNFAFNQARGKYVILLADDDYLQPDYLKEIDMAINKTLSEIFFTSIAIYQINENKKILKYTKYSNKLIEISSDKFLKNYFELHVGHPSLIPQPSTLCFSREIGRLTIKKYSLLYGAPCPEVIAIPHIVKLTEKIVLVDKPLLIAGIVGNSWSAKMQSKNITIRQTTINSNFKHTMCKGAYLGNSVRESLLRVKKCPEFDKYKYSRIQEAKCYFKDMMALKKKGYHIKKDLFEYLFKVPLHILLATIPSILLRFCLMSIFRKFKLLDLIKSLISIRRRGQVTSGWSIAEVTNIREASKFMEGSK